MGHETDYTEDDESSEYTGGAVADSDEDTVAEEIVVESVVAGQGDESAPARGQREKDLHRRIRPDLGLSQAVPLRSQIELDSLGSTRKCETADQQNGQNEVRE